MTKEDIFSAFSYVFENDERIRETVFADADIPQDISEAVLNISSLDFVELIIEIEEQLNLDSIPETAMEQGITIDKLAERILENVQ